MKFFAFFAISACSAFMLSPVSRSNSRKSSLKVLLTETEAVKLMEKANACAESECSVSDIAEFLGDLRDQQNLLTARLNDIDAIITSLTSMNEIEDPSAREIDEMKESIKSIARVFAVGAKASGNDYPSLGFAVGYSGEKSGKGAAGTAWDLDMSKGKK